MVTEILCNLLMHCNHEIDYMVNFVYVIYSLYCIFEARIAISILTDIESQFLVVSIWVAFLMSYGMLFKLAF